MVYRIYAERKKGLDIEADELKREINDILGINSLEGLRIFRRYDVENIDGDIFDKCIPSVFSEPQTDVVYSELPCNGDYSFGVEYLPGQFDQRADSAAQCIQFVSAGDRPRVRSAKIYVLTGELTKFQIEKIEKYVINPVESRKAVFALPDTLNIPHESPPMVQTLDGFIDKNREELLEFIDEYGLAMDIEDIIFCKQYFIEEQRNPTVTEIRMIDTYWSDHCRHTTFSTVLNDIQITDAKLQKSFHRYLSIREELYITAPITLMDMATVGAKYLKKKGILKNLDESEEINACTVKIKVDVDGEMQDWLLLFKNETHNHPTEIEPFGGAATCIGGAIRDPLSGRAYVYQAMRVTGAADPTLPVSETMQGKLPQRKIVTTAAEGYSSYGNQIGLATGLVDEIYHSGYAAKRMEIGAVIGAAPAENVVREQPSPGDVVILLGGRTGRDGCGGATGSSKSHDISSLEECGAQVQKGNAPEERKLQRLFRDKQAARLIKRCNDFGAGGVSVAIGELADGLDIDLDCVPKKYDGLDGTELAISESQERMAVVVAPCDIDKFIALAEKENLQAVVVAVVTEQKRLVMKWRGRVIVDIARSFLNSNGAKKYVTVKIDEPCRYSYKTEGSAAERFEALAEDLNVCSKRGLAERFDSTIGAATVLMPFGGKYQRTPTQVMAAKIPLIKGQTKTCSVMSYGYNPFIMEKNQYAGAYLAVVESISKLVAAGAYNENCYLTFQEYFERLASDPKRWAKPTSALLGALDAQLDLGIASIGGKDSMSGSFEDLDVPPTLVSFAVSTCDVNMITTPEFKKTASKVVLISPEYDKDGLVEPCSLKTVFDTVTKLIRDNKVLSIYTPVYGGIAAAVMKMSFGNRIGFNFAPSFSCDDVFAYKYGSFIIELAKDIEVGVPLGETTSDFTVTLQEERIDLYSLYEMYENRLEKVFACNNVKTLGNVKDINFTGINRTGPRIKSALPRIFIPVFPGTNCEYDTARAFERVGGKCEIIVINNMSPSGIVQSLEAVCKAIKKSQIIMLPGGFSGGDEPDGSGKFITAFFRNPLIKDAVHDLLNNRDGLMGGICNGFQALIKLGLVPFGEIREMDSDCATLTFNTIGRHQSMLVRTRIASVKSPWLSACKVGDIHTVAISHGEGRFLCDDSMLQQLITNGQIATQYADMKGHATMDIAFNPNGSVCAVEGITSPDGRVFGKMGHTERTGRHLYKNVAGETDNGMFKSAVDYFQ